MVEINWEKVEIASISAHLLAISMKSEFDLRNLSTEKMLGEAMGCGMQHS